MKKYLFVFILFSLALSNKAFGEDFSLPVKDLSDNKSFIKTEKPVENDFEHNVKLASKIDLRAVILDNNESFDEQADVDEISEKTKMQHWQEDIHQALHGEVTKISGDPLLKKYLTKDFERGPFSQLSFWSGMRGSMQNIWSGADYENTLYNNNMLFSILDGKFKNQKFSFRSMYLWTPSKPQDCFFNSVIGDQFITYNINDSDKLIFGYSRYENGYEGNMGPQVIPFFHRSQIAKAYGDERNLGLKAEGVHKFYNYNIGVGSAGRHFRDWFPGPEFNAGFAIKPLANVSEKYGQMLIGGTYDGGNAQEGRFSVGNAFIDYKYKRLEATFEYGVANGSNGAVGYSSNKSEGYNATLAYRVTPKIQVLGRYDSFDPNKEKANDIRNEYTVGMNYFIKGQALRLMLNYTMYSVESGVYGSRLYTGTQILL